MIAVVVIAITALPGLDEVRARPQGADPVWIVALVVAEIASRGGYVLVFRSTFCSQMSWGLSYDIAMAELAANSLLPAGGAGGLALGVWALRQAGDAHRSHRAAHGRVLRRHKRRELLRACCRGGRRVHRDRGRPRVCRADARPAVITAMGILLVAFSPRLLRALRRRGAGADPWRWLGRARAAVRDGLGALADGVDEAIALLRVHSFGVIVGSFAYMAFDIAALGFGFAAVGPAPTFGVLVPAT